MSTDLHAALDQAARIGSSITAESELEPCVPNTPVAGPTYAGTGYLLYGRKPSPDKNITGKDARYEHVEMNSVAAEGNLVEQAVLGAHRARNPNLFFPLIEADFTDVVPNLALKITTLDAPHGPADARLRDCLLEGVHLRDHEIGQSIFNSSPDNLTGLFLYSPFSILTGTWDTHAPKNDGEARFKTNRQLRIRRSLTSQVVGDEAYEKPRRFTLGDPLHFSSDLKLSSDDYYSSKKWKFKEGKEASSIGLAAVPSSEEDSACGGLMVERLRYWANLAPPVLRRYRFPLKGDDSLERDHAARKMILALGVLGIVLRSDEGFCLRSNCDLRPKDELLWKIYGRTSKQEFLFKGNISRDQAYAAYERAYADLKEHGLVWAENRVFRMVPSAPLRAAIARNYESEGRSKKDKAQSGNGKRGQ